MQRERSEQGRPEELLLPTAGAVVGLGKKMSKRCSGYRIIRLRYHLLVAEFSLLVVAEFFSMPDQPEGLGVHIYRLLASQVYAKMLV